MPSESRKKWLFAAAMTIAVAGGGAAGVLLGTPGLSSAQTAGDESTDSTEPPFGEGLGWGPGAPAGHGARGPHAHIAKLEVAAETIGITEEELRTELEASKSIATVATEHGVDPQTVIDALVADATAHIDEEVAEGDLEAERAEEIKAELPERMADVVNREGLPEGRHGRGPGPGPGAGIGCGRFDVAAATIGVTEEELRTELEDGKSIATVATEHGVDPQTVIDALVADATAHIDEEVAEGDLEAERAEEIKAELPERMAEFVHREGLRGRGPG